MIRRPKKNLEDMSMEELQREFSRVNKKATFRTLKQDEEGSFILDPNNQHDREWYENDRHYDF
ncbi:hypothetical protein CAI16_13415 [Virgibacillus dokdonensis]|uniref:Uncharacterized protein n=1 Tax=Virgibacillus dokdonensis TaxID=302167 RepID=A0A3E0WM13_9BACI|nr:hypothetical protein [Virgibacillus dokdonensis]RFA33848.1 hypothetical protein CAI16_13415 [Virgibacillus dokdonensis]